MSHQTILVHRLEETNLTAAIAIGRGYRWIVQWGTGLESRMPDEAYATACVLAVFCFRTVPRISAETHSDFLERNQPAVQFVLDNPAKNGIAIKKKGRWIVEWPTGMESKMPSSAHARMCALAPELCAVLANPDFNVLSAFIDRHQSLFDIAKIFRHPSSFTVIQDKNCLYAVHEHDIKALEMTESRLLDLTPNEYFSWRQSIPTILGLPVGSEESREIADLLIEGGAVYWSTWTDPAGENE